MFTIDEFITSVGPSLAAFKAATEREAASDPTWPNVRSEVGWYKELLAYMMYVELEEQFHQE